MKKNGLLIISFALVFAAIMTSCKEEPRFDGSLIVGKWVSGTEYWRYDTDNTGVTWDEKDDVHEEEGQLFKWDFDSENDQLTHIHWMEMTGDWTIPKVYTVTALDNNKLSYTDKYGQEYIFTRVSD